MNTTPIVELNAITKRFPGVIANDNVTLDIRRGEIHTLLGENGAGKSTLMKMLYGMLQPDSGTIKINGEVVHINTPSAAIALGVGMVHQHFMLVPSLTVAENLAMGEKMSVPRRKPKGDKVLSLFGPLLRTTRRATRVGLNLSTISRRIKELSEQYGLKVDPSSYVWQLSVGEQQRVEIIKALYREAHVLILDEPTAVLTPKEVSDLFKVLNRMKENGRGIVFISHKLYEVLEISDRISVLRDGRVVGSTTPAEATRESLVNMMVGREVSLQVERPPQEISQVRLRVENISAQSDRGSLALNNVSFEVRAGEILGLAGVSGNGQKELAEVISGLRSATSGRVLIDQKDVTTLPVSAHTSAGLAYVPEERMKDGAIRTFSVQDNAILQTHGNAPVSTRGILNFHAIRQLTQGLIDSFNVKTPNQQTQIRNLSGGNIQKLILARELSRLPSVLIAAQPTRGVDIGATMYIHKRLIEQRAQGTATLLISEDLDEVIALCDRIAVIYEGEIRGIIPRGEATPDTLGMLMAGGHTHA